jgi:SAM-dependent methyltransferase
MNTRNTNAANSSSLKADTVTGILLIVAGVVILIISRGTDLQDIWSDLGFLLIGIGISLISWRLIVRRISPNMVNVIRLMRREKLQNIMRDQEKGKELIIKCFHEWAQSLEGSTIKIKGVTLGLTFADGGILQELLEKGKLINPDTKKIQALLLNPYSMNAITRSIQESRPFRRPTHPDPVKEICQHSLDRHKDNLLHEDFMHTVRNIRNLIRYSGAHKIEVECRIYSALSPSFLLISDRRAITENLILSPKKNAEQQKLYGALPHLVYGKGEIKDSLESHFDYMWNYDSVPLEDFHLEVEEKYFEINRLFLLYRLQAEIWERQWKNEARSRDSEHHELYTDYKAKLPQGFSPKRILDLGCGDGGGGSLEILRDYPNAAFDFVDIAPTAIEFLKAGIAKQDSEDEVNYRFSVHTCDMLTFLNRCKPLQYSLVYANFSIIYMTKIKAIEVYRRVFSRLRGGGVFMLSLYTPGYFDMEPGQHGKRGEKPDHEFVRIPMTEDLRVLTGGSEPLRYGEIRRFYRNYEELLEEFRIADENNTMDFEGIEYRYYENGAILRVWIHKK